MRLAADLRQNECGAGKTDRIAEITLKVWELVMICSLSGGQGAYHYYAVPGFLLFGNIYAVLPKQENSRPGAGVERAHN